MRWIRRWWRRWRTAKDDRPVSIRPLWRRWRAPPFLGQVSPQWLQQYHEATGEAFERNSR